MLGVRREGGTEAAGKLQQAGVISYRRGNISVLDRAGLESQVCECYAVVKAEFARLLPDALLRQNFPPQTQDAKRDPDAGATVRSVGGK